MIVKDMVGLNIDLHFKQKTCSQSNPRVKASLKGTNTSLDAVKGLYDFQSGISP